jgi:hypothetical protein
MTASELAGAVWHKSSRSNGQGQCVEVARIDQAVAFRDSKDPAGPVLTLTSAEWVAFISGAQDGEFEL